MKYPIMMMTLLFTVACGASNGEKPELPLAVDLLAVDRFCGHKDGLSIIDSATPSALQPMVVTQTISKVKLDWTQSQVLRINMGSQPNMGYSLGYSGGARYEDKRLIIPIIWNRPEAGRMYAQMLVEPCLLLSIPRQGYESIEVIDQAGHLHWSLKGLNP